MRRISVAYAICVGYAWIVLPIFLIGLGSLAGLVACLAITDGRPFSLAHVALIAAAGMIALVAPWLWWSFTVPRWRLWAYQRVDDIGDLNRWAVRLSLIWPEGHPFERTEIRPERLAAQLRDIEEQRGLEE